MTNRKSNGNKNNSEVLEPDVLAQETEEVPPKKPTVKKNVTNTRVERFVEEVAVDETDDDAIDAEFEDELDEEDEEEREKSDIEILLEQTRANSEYWMRIDSLPDYQIDGRADPGAKRLFCMNLRPPDLDYLDKLEKKYHGGDFIVFLYKRGKGGGLVKYWDDHIAIAAQPVIETTPAPAIANVTQAQPTPSRIEETLNRLMLKRMEKAIDMLDNPPEPPPPIAPPAQLPPQPTMEERILELAGKNESLADKIVKRYIGSDEDEEKSSIVGDILKRPKEALQFVGGVLGMIKTTFMPNAPQLNGQPQIEAPPVDPVMQMLEPIRGLIEGISIEMMNDAPIENTIQAIETWKSQTEGADFYLNIIVNASSVEVINTLAQFTRNGILIKLRHGPEWIESLQSALRGEQPEQESETE